MPDCITKYCKAEATHVVLTFAHTWHRTAVLASAAPQPGGTIGFGSRADDAAPYYCEGHAKAREVTR